MGGLAGTDRHNKTFQKGTISYHWELLGGAGCHGNGLRLPSLHGRQWRGLVNGEGERLKNLVLLNERGPFQDS